MKIKYLNKKLVVLGVFLIISIVIMQFFDTPLKNEVCKNGIVSFELAKEIFNTKAIINSWNKDAKASAFYSLLFDFVFILVYTSFISLMIYKINTKLWNGKSFYKVGKILIYATFIAGIFDVIENISLIKLLNGSTQQTHATLAYYFASMKFTILLIGIIYLIGSWIILLTKKNI
jgi:hypothetical protein